MQDILTQFLREQAMQEIITGNMRETKDSGGTWAALERIEAHLMSSDIVMDMHRSADLSRMVKQAGAVLTE